MMKGLIGKTDIERLLDHRDALLIIRELEQKYPRLRDLSDEAKISALFILLKKENLDQIEGIKNFFFKRRIVSIEEFLTEKYIGQEYIFYPEKEGEVGHVWRRALIDIFSLGSPVREVILTGAIGTAKTSVSRLIHFYNTYRVTSLRHPQISMGSSPGKWMNLQFMSVTRGKAQSTLLDPFKTLLRQSSVFIEVDKVEDFEDFSDESMCEYTPWVDEGEEIIFPNNIRVVQGSRDHHALGEDLYGASLDEAEFRIVSKSVDQVFETYSQMVERIRSRFLNCPFTIATLVSSISSESGVIASYVKTKYSSSDPRVKIYSHSIWEVRYPRELEKGYWYVLRGSRTYPSRVLTEEEVLLVDQNKFSCPPGTEVVKIPMRFLPDFKANTERALRNLAGLMTFGDEQLIPDVSHIVDKRIASEKTISISIDSDLSILEMLRSETDLFYTDFLGTVRFRRYPEARRYAHMDLAEVTEAGLCIVHKEREKETGKTLIVTDLVLRITTSDRIPLSKILDFFVDLKEKCRVNFQVISADQFQSTLILQSLSSKKVSSKITRVSVDRDLTPYRLLSNMVFERRVVIGDCPVLSKQLTNLFVDRDKVYTKMRKDLADAFCGAVFLAESEHLDQPTSYLFQRKEETANYQQFAEGIDYLEEV